MKKNSLNNTVNSELQNKIESLSETNDDMQNLLNSTDIATIFLDCNLKIKRFTRQAKNIIKLIDSDTGRPLEDLVSTLKLTVRSILPRVREIVAEYFFLLPWKHQYT